MIHNSGSRNKNHPKTVGQKAVLINRQRVCLGILDNHKISKPNFFMTEVFKNFYFLIYMLLFLQATVHIERVTQSQSVPLTHI